MQLADYAWFIAEFSATLKRLYPEFRFTSLRIQSLSLDGSDYEIELVAEWPGRS